MNGMEKNNLPQDESIYFYADARKSVYMGLALIAVPSFVILFFLSFFFFPLKDGIIFFWVCTGIFLFIFGISAICVYHELSHAKIRDPYITLYNDSLLLYNRYGPIIISLRNIIGFTTTKGRIMGARALVLITKDFKKKYTRCWTGPLTSAETARFFGALQAKGLTYFPLGSDFLKK